ncbi:unnamed protein product [Ixodes persulcatus]
MSVETRKIFSKCLSCPYVKSCKYCQSWHGTAALFVSEVLRVAYTCQHASKAFLAVFFFFFSCTSSSNFVLSCFFFWLQRAWSFVTDFTLCTFFDNPEYFNFFLYIQFYFIF